MGLLPITGVPLLFVSYGGSSMITSFILVGIFTQFIIRYSDSYILLYRFITVIAYPILIDYADIKNIELISKYKIVVEAKNKKYSMYVFNASNRYLDLREKWSDYNEKNWLSHAYLFFSR